MQLAQLQRAFQARVLAGEPAIEPELARPGAADFGERLGAYVDGYRSRLVEALGTTYPALRKTLGEGEFDRRMRDYIEATPSLHYSVRYYGAAVAERMSDAGEKTASGMLSELARWEWLLSEVFDAPDDVPLAAGDLGRVPPAAWAGVAFSFRASVRRLRLDTNAVDFWRAASGLCAAPTAYTTAPASEWLLWRRGVAIFFRSLDAPEAAAIDAAIGGESFGELCERLAAVVDATDVAMRAASLLRGWIAEELIAGYVLAVPAA